MDKEIMRIITIQLHSKCAPNRVLYFHWRDYKDMGFWLPNEYMNDVIDNIALLEIL